jgi:hypothetical protein
MSPLLLAVILVAAPGPAAASPHTPFDDCEANFLTALGAWPAQFSPLHTGDLGRTRIRFRLSNQRAVMHRDFGRAVWTLEIRGPGEGGAVVYSQSGVGVIDEGAIRDVELFWNGRNQAGQVVPKGEYEVSLRTRYVPHRVAGSFKKPLRAVEDVDPAVQGVEEAEPQKKLLIVDAALPLKRAKGFATAANIGGCQVQQNTPLIAGWPYNFYYGSLHSHSTWSDGGLDVASCSSGKYGVGAYDPAAIYTYARNSAGLDYYLVNDHNHIIPDAIANLDPPTTADKTRAKYQAGLAAAQAATVDGAFVALYGMEWGTISQGGHVSLIETPKLFGWDCGSCTTAPNCPASQCNYDVYTSQTDYLAMFKSSVDNPSAAGPLAVLAHPQSGDYNNYSVDANSLAAVQGIAVRSGLAFPPYAANCANTNIASTDYSTRWRAALGLGFKLGPTGDHDAHCANWGTGIPTRTVYVLRNDAGAPVLTKTKLLQAHKARHFFATEDSNAQLAFGTTDGAQIMGDAFSVGDSASMKVTHADPEGVTPTKIEIYRGVVGGSFTVYKTFTAVSTATLTESVTAGNVTAGQTYWYYAHVVQNDAPLNELFSAPMWITYGVSCADTTAPTVGIVSPATGSTVTCGDSTIAVSATDAGGVASVEVRVDGGAWSAAAKDASGNWLYSWASSQATDGTHLIEARATDSSCGHNVSNPVSVSVTRQAAPLATVQPASIDFGNQHTAQASGPLPAKLLNGGCAALSVTGYSISGANAADFGASPASGALSIPAGGSATWPVVFTPSAAGARAATLTFLSPTGNKSISLAGTGAVPVASLSTTALSFGSVRKGVVSATQPVTLTNTGPVALSFTGWALSGANASSFTASPASAASVVAAGGALTFNVAFAPNATGALAGTLTLNTEVGAKAVSLGGTGVFPATTVTPGSLAFGDVRVGATAAAQGVAVKNTGTDVLHLTGWGFDGADAADFSVTPTSAATDVAVNQTVTLQVGLKPSSVGAKAARLLVHGDNGDQLVTLTGNGTAPAFTLSPATLAFGDQRAQQASVPLPVTATNTGTAALTISAPSVTGAQAADFSVSGPAGAVTLGAGDQAVWQVTFTPGATGARSAAIIFTSDAGARSAALTGNGIAPQATLSATSVAFGNQRRGTTSAPQQAALTNDGTAPLAVTGWALTGPDAASFAVTPASAAGTLQPATSLTLTLRCTPAAVGARSAVLSIATELGPRDVALGCTGTFPITQLSPASLSFGGQPPGQASSPLALTVTNGGTDTLTVSGYALAGPDAADFSVSPATTSTTLGVGASTTLQLTFTPSAAGARAATLTLTADDGTRDVALSGSGTAAGATVSANALSFGTLRQGTLSAAKTFDLTSIGSAAVSLSGYDLTGPNPGDFTVDPASAAGVLQPGVTQTYTVRFAPAGTGARAATLTLHTDVGDRSVALGGTSIFPAVTLSSAVLSFGDQRKGTSSSARTVTLTNTGSDVLSLTGPAVTGAAAEFAVSASSTAFQLAPGASASFGVVFTPAATGTRSAGLSFSGDLSPTVVLVGNGIFPSAQVSVASLAFGNQRRGTTSDGLPVTLTNVGGTALTFSGAALSGSGAAAWSVSPLPAPVTLGAGDSVTWALAFSPVQDGPHAATWTLTTDDGPRTITLSGAGVFPHATASTGALAFGDVRRGVASAAQPFTLTNSGTDTLQVSGFGASGANAADLAVTPSSAAVQLAPGQSQTWSVKLTPSAAGARAASLAFHGDEGDTVVTISGNGVIPGATLSSSALAFGDQRRGTASAPGTVTLTSSGTAPLAVAGWTLSGAGAADFSVSPVSQALGLAPAASADWFVLLRPTATGARTATLTFATDAGPQAVALSGRGIYPAAQVSPQEATFGDQPLSATSSARNLALSNAGTDTLAFTGRALVGGEASEFALTGPQSGSLAPGESAAFAVTFTPANTGQRKTTLRLSTEVGDLDVLLTGSGVTPVADVAPGAIDFGAQRSKQASAARTVTLSNSGGAALPVTGYTVTGAQAAEFAVTPATAQTSIDPAGQAQWSITFTPASAGARAATLTFQTGVGDRQVSLQGTGVEPVVTASTSALTFASQQTGSRSPAQTVTVRNTGSAPAQVSGWSLAGAQAAEFEVTPASAARALAPGGSLDLQVIFAPAGPGARAATLTVQTETGALEVALAGTGAQAAASGGCSSQGGAQSALLALGLAALLLRRRKHRAGA